MQQTRSSSQASRPSSCGHRPGVDGGDAHRNGLHSNPIPQDRLNELACHKAPTALYRFEKHQEILTSPAAIHSSRLRYVSAKARRFGSTSSTGASRPMWLRIRPQESKRMPHSILFPKKHRISPSMLLETSWRWSFCDSPIS